MLKHQFLPTFSHLRLTCLILAIGSTFCPTIAQAIPLEGFPKPPTTPNNSPTATQKRAIKVKIVSAKALTKFDTFIPLTDKHKADFYSIVRFNNSVNYKTHKFNDNDNPTFNETLKEVLPMSVSTVPIEIHLVDSDGDSPFDRVSLIDALTDKDDVADINPSSSRNLKLEYIPATGAVRLDGREIGRRGQTITLQGDGTKNNASISFSIEHSDVFTVPAT